MRYLWRAAEADPAHLLGDDRGTLAITGVGIIGRVRLRRLLFEGRDPRERLRQRHDASAASPSVIGAFAALLTSFYRWRLIFLTFYGKPRWAGSEHIQHAVHHDPRGRRRRGAWRQRATIMACKPSRAPPAIIRTKARGRCWCRSACCRSARSSPASCSTHPFVVGRGRATSGTAASRSDEHLAHAMHEVPLWVKLTPARRDADRPRDRLQRLHPLDRTSRRSSSRSSPGCTASSLNKWYFDELYDVDLRPPGVLARPLVLEARRRADDRPLRPARRRVWWSASATASPRGSSRAISTATRW